MFSKPEDLLDQRKKRATLAKFVSSVEFNSLKSRDAQREIERSLNFRKSSVRILISDFSHANLLEHWRLMRLEKDYH